MVIVNRERLVKELFGVTLRTLESVPVRALTFLRAVGLNRVIYATLARQGYDPVIHLEAWEDLKNTGNIAITAVVGELDPEVSAAVVKVDEMDGDIIRVITASLKHQHPEQLAYILRGSKPATGMEATWNCAQIVEGCKGLENDPNRESKREEDHKVLEILKKRGFGPKEREELSELVKIATSTPKTKPPTAEQEAKEDETYVRTLGKLWRWYDEWSEIARVAIKRRDHLIQLGLAKRKSVRGTEDREEETEE